MSSSLVAASPLAAAIVWSIALLVDPGPYEPASILLIGVGLLGMATVSLVGIVVARGRWALRLGLVAVAATLVLAITRPIDVFWVIGLVATALATTSLFLPVVTSNVRKLPSASGPPPRAILTVLVLIGAPFLIGVTSASPNWTDVVAGLSAPVSAFGYARVIPGGLWSVRIIWPALAVVLGIVDPGPAGAVGAALGVTVAVLAWHPSVKTAYHPPREMGSTFPIPPELTPPEVLDAAQIEDRGQTK